MTRYRKHLLDERANQYIARVLSSGRSLCHALLERHTLNSGAVEAFVPSEWSGSVLYGFESGWPIPNTESASPLSHDIEARGSMRLAAATLLGQMTNEDDVCLAEHRLTYCDDPFMQRDIADGSPIMCLGRYAYGVIKHGSSHDAATETLKGAAVGALLVAAVGSIPGFNPSPGGVLSEKSIATLVDSSIAVVVSAYDDDGLLLWRPV